MSGLNKVLVIGHLGRDPEVKNGVGGMTIAKFSVAVSHRKKDGAEDVEWINIVTFGKTAEACGQYLAKGRLVYVEGRLSTSSYQKEGESSKRYSTEVLADRVDFLGKAPADARADNNAAPAWGGNKAKPEKAGFKDPDFTDDDMPF